MFHWTYEPYISTAYEAIKLKIYHIDLFDFRIAQKYSKILVNRIENQEKKMKQGKHSME